MTGPLSHVRAMVLFIAFLAWTLVALVPYLTALGAGRGYRAMAAMWATGCLWLAGVELSVFGERSGRRPTLFVGNHASYLDVLVLMRLARGAFVAKSEVGTWPGVGFIAKIGRTVYASRSGRNSASERDHMSERLSEGENLILFPEGTSNDGNRVLPFKSALLAPAERPVDGRPIPVQPVSIAYVGLNGYPMSRDERQLVAWYGDMDLLPHLWNLFRLGRVQAVVQFHQPVSLDVFGNRKALAHHCYAVVAGGVAAANSGRLPVPAGAVAAARPERNGEPSS